MSTATAEPAKNWTLTFMALGALSGLTAFFLYMEGRKDRKLKSDILVLDRQIKELELAKRMHEKV